MALVLGTACSASPAPARPSAGATSAEQRAPHAGGHHAVRLPEGPVAEMQVVLRPLAHGDLGAERDTRICAGADSLRQRAGAIVAAPVPAAASADADAWRAGVARLSREADALVAECTSPARAAVAQRLEALHVAFHELTDNLSP
ncbi:MAG: hypothetical protein U0326_09525 [Polyangiales bacterium]